MHNLNSICFLSNEERNLLDRIADKDLEAFWILWQQHHDYLRRVALRLSQGDTHETDDILGDACIRLADHMPRHAASIGDSRRWFARVVVNVGIDRMRGRRRGTAAIGTMSDVAELIDAVGPADPRTPELEAALRERMRHILAVFAGLPERLGTPARLYFIDNRAYANIARELSISPALARKRIQEVRTILKQVLGEPHASAKNRLS